MACNRAVSSFRQGALIADIHARQQGAAEAWDAAIRSWENLIANSADGGRINREARRRLTEARALKGKT